MSTLDVPIRDIDVAATLRPLLMLAGDPTVRLGPGAFERATWTPTGPAAVRVTWNGTAPTGSVQHARAEAFGDGAGWLLDRLPGLLGCLDDVTGFAPASDPLRRLWHQHRGVRVMRTGTVWHDLMWTVVQQRVSRVEAARQWHGLVTAFGGPAPGVSGLLTPPEPATLARLTYADLHPLGIERRRAGTLIAAARVGARVQALADRAAPDALDALRTLPGVGPWTTACLSAFTWGDPDTVIVGDDGIPSIVAWLLAGERRADDQRMLNLLEPYRPHRYRVVKLAFAGGVRPPRTAPRGQRHDIRGR